MDPRLRAAVDASRAWYDDVLALHAVPVRVEDGLWQALGDPPPWHSSVKTLEPGVAPERVLEAAEGRARCGVADSFGELDLGGDGFDLVVDATWLHRPADPLGAGPTALPGGWSVVATPEVLARWSERHDYAGVLLPGVLDHPAFTVLACLEGGEPVAGAVLHDGGGAVGLSNAWAADGHPLDWDALLAAAALVHPGRDLTDYAAGDDLDTMLAAGFSPLGPQRVWVR